MLSTAISTHPIHHIKAQLLTCRSRDHQITIHTGLFILDHPLLLSTFLFILSIPFQIHCLVPCPTSQYLPPFLTIFSYTASLSVTPPYAPSFPFLSFSFPSHSYWLYHYIFILALTHPLIHHSYH